jgi:processive 1,2-diacylglycerol beta-glucosyltransferase
MIKFCSQKKIVFIINLFFAFILSGYANDSIVQKKKKIIILSSKGGAGHIAAGQTLTSLLEKEYDLKSVYPLETILTPLDFVKNITGTYSCEQIYNRIIQGGWNNFVNFYVKNIAPFQILSRRKKIEKLFYDFFNKEKPDLIISIIPLFNWPAKNAADKFNIPYLLVALDIDLSLWALGLDKINPNNFYMTFYDNFVKKGFEKKLKNLSYKQLKPIGMPIREEFLRIKDSKEKAQIKKEWNIPENKFTILMMMGGNGGDALVSYAKTIAQSCLPVHVLACIGHKISLKKELDAIAKQKSEATFTIIPYTNKVADLMSVSDIFITKAGGSSFNEAKTMQLPILIDQTQTPLFWEKGTIRYVENKQIGISIKKFRNLKKIIQKYLNKDYYSKQKENLKKLPGKNFNSNFLNLVHNICSTSTGLSNF